jgi:hypothetical protein
MVTAYALASFCPKTASPARRRRRLVSARRVFHDLPEGGGQGALRVHVPRALEEPVPVAGS